MFAVQSSGIVSQDSHHLRKRSLDEGGLQVFSLDMIDADIRMELKEMGSILDEDDSSRFIQACNAFLNQYMRFEPECFIKDQFLNAEGLALYLDLKISIPDDSGNSLEPDEYAQGVEWVFQSVGEDFIRALAVEEGGTFSKLVFIEASAYNASSEEALAEKGSSKGVHRNTGIYLSISSGVAIGILMAVVISVLLFLRRGRSRQTKAVEVDGDIDLEEFKDASSSHPTSSVEETEPTSVGFDDGDTFFTVSDGGSGVLDWPLQRYTTGGGNVLDFMPFSTEEPSSTDQYDHGRVEVPGSRLLPISPLSGISRIRSPPVDASSNRSDQSSTFLITRQSKEITSSNLEVVPDAPTTAGLDLRRSQERRFTSNAHDELTMATQQLVAASSFHNRDSSDLTAGRESPCDLSNRSLTLDSYISFESEAPTDESRLRHRESPPFRELRGNDETGSLTRLEEKRMISYKYNEIVKIHPVSESSDDEGLSSGAEVESIFVVGDDILVEVEKDPRGVCRIESTESESLEEERKPSARSKRKGRRPTFLKRFMKSEGVKQKDPAYHEDPDRKAPYWITTRSSDSTSEDGAMSNISDLSIVSSSSDDLSVDGIAMLFEDSDRTGEGGSRDVDGRSRAEGINIRTMFPPRPQLAMKTTTLCAGALQTPERSVHSTTKQPPSSHPVGAGGPSLPSTPTRPQRPPRSGTGVPQPYSSLPSTPNRPPRNTFQFATSEPSPMSSITVTPERLPKGTSLLNGTLPSANSSLNSTPKSHQYTVTPVRVKPLLGGSIPGTPSTPSTTTHSTDASSSGSVGHGSPFPPTRSTIFDRLSRSRSLFSGKVPSPSSDASPRQRLDRSNMYSVPVPEFHHL